DVSPGALQRWRERLGRRAVEAAAIVFGRHLRDDRKTRHRAHRADRGLQLVEVAERLEDKEINAALGERRGLLSKRRLRFVEARPAPGLDAYAERSNRSSYPRRIVCRLTCDSCAFEVDVVDLVGESEVRQLEPVRAERVRLDDVGAGAQIFLMDVGHEPRLREVQLVEAVVEKNPARVEHRPPRAVTDEHARIQGREKRGTHGNDSIQIRREDTRRVTRLYRSGRTGEATPAALQSTRRSEQRGVRRQRLAEAAVVAAGTSRSSLSQMK